MQQANICNEWVGQAYGYAANGGCAGKLVLVPQVLKILSENITELTARVAVQDNDKEEATKQHAEESAKVIVKLTQARQELESLESLHNANEKQLAARENAQKAHEDTLRMQIGRLEAELRIKKEPVETVFFPGVPGNGSRFTVQVADFVPTHGGKAHRRTPSWWQGP